MSFRAFAFAAAILLSAPAWAAEPAPASSPAGRPLTFATGFSIPSRILGEEREVNVRLPAGYDKAGNARKYPVLYVIDGGMEQDFLHIAGLAQHAEMSGTYDTFIVVGIATKKRIWELTPLNRDERYTTYLRASGEPVDFASGGGVETFRRFIADEVIPFVDKSFRTDSRRILIGESLAGFFVVDTLLKAPQHFTDYVSISPSMWWNREELGVRAAELLRGKSYEGRRFYVTMGSEGGTMQRGLDRLLAALRTPAAGALKWVYVDRRNAEHHGSIYHAAALDAFRTLDPKPTRPGSPLSWLHIGEMAPLSPEAEADKKVPCTAERARRVTFAEIHADPAKWEALCVLTPLGQGPQPREVSKNWDARPKN